MKILARVVDAYRRIRNTLRFLMANVSDFDPAKDAVPYGDLLEIDRYALSRAAQLQADILAHYEIYEFQPVVSKLQIYCSEDLGSFYLDILKDRLYTTGAKSLARRSAQTALHAITHAMLHWMAPFLSFTAEEAWKIFGASESIFLETYADFGHQNQPQDKLQETVFQQQPAALARPGAAAADRRPVHQSADPGVLPAGRGDSRDRLFQCRSGSQHRRGVLVSGVGVGLAALVFYRNRSCRGGVHHLDAQVGQKLFSSAMACMLGGAVGNVIDFHYGGWHVPAFNIADSAITVGAICLILDELQRVRSAR